jgi:hypothetical protein
MGGVLRPLAAVAVMVLIGAGCSKTPAPTPGGRGANNSANNVDQAVKFSQCMRSNGVSGFPDPSPSGQLTIDGVVNGSSLNTDSPAFQQALSACKDLEPAGFMGSTRTPQQQAAALKFAQCMRDNGISDFPDPTPDGPVIDVKGARRIPGFQAALAQCSTVYAGQLGLGGQ